MRTHSQRGDASDLDLHMVLVTYRWPAPNTRASGRPHAAPFRGAAGRGPNPGRRSGRRAVDSSLVRTVSRRITVSLALGEVTNYVYYRVSCSEVETKRLRTCWVPCSSTVLRVHAVVRRPRPCLSMARLNHRLNGASSGLGRLPAPARLSPLSAPHTHRAACAALRSGRHRQIVVTSPQSTRLETLASGPVVMTWPRRPR